MEGVLLRFYVEEGVIKVSCSGSGFWKRPGPPGWAEGRRFGRLAGLADIG